MFRVFCFSIWAWKGIAGGSWQGAELAFPKGGELLVSVGLTPGICSEFCFPVATLPGLIHSPSGFLPAQTDIITRIYSMKCFFEVTLASSEGLAYRVNSSRIQDSFWIQAHWRQPTCISASLQSQKTTGFTFTVCFASPFQEWVVSWQYLCLLSNPFTTPLFHLLLFSTATKSDLAGSERRQKMQKT